MSKTSNEHSEQRQRPNKALNPADPSANAGSIGSTEPIARQSTSSTTTDWVIFDDDWLVREQWLTEGGSYIVSTLPDFLIFDDDWLVREQWLTEGGRGIS